MGGWTGILIGTVFSVGAPPAQQPTGRLEYTIPFGLLEYTIRKSVETTLDGGAEYTVEVP